MKIQEIIEQRLRQQLTPKYLNVIDESYKHVGHPGARAEGESHFAIEIEAEELKSLSRVEAHKKIYALLDNLMNNPIHALAIKVIK